MEEKAGSWAMTMSLYLTDTHTLYWHFIGSPRLSPKARSIIGDAAAGSAVLAVPHIVIAELFWTFQKFSQGAAFSRAYGWMRSSPACRLESTTDDNLLELPTYTEIPEMHDRLIVIQANRLGATIVTKDASMHASRRARCVW